MIDVWMIDIALWVVVLFTGALIPIGVILLAEQAVRAVQALLAWRRRDEPVPYWPAEGLVLPACPCPPGCRCPRSPHATLLREHAMLLTALCDPCRGGDGECVCTVQCGQLGCVGGFSDEDVTWLRSLTMPEGTGQ